MREAGLLSMGRSTTVGLLMLLAMTVLTACANPVRFHVVTQAVAEDNRPAKHPANPPYPDSEGSATWVSGDDVAFSSVAGITVTNLKSGATRALGHKAYTARNVWTRPVVSGGHILLRPRGGTALLILDSGSRRVHRVDLGEPAVEVLPAEGGGFFVLTPDRALSPRWKGRRGMVVQAAGAR